MIPSSNDDSSNDPGYFPQPWSEISKKKKEAKKQYIKEKIENQKEQEQTKTKHSLKKQKQKNKNQKEYINVTI